MEIDRAALLKRLREKVLKEIALREEGPPVAGIFLLMRDLNYLHLELLRELGRLTSTGDLSPEALSILLETEGLNVDEIALRGKGLQDRSDGELLQAAGALPLICLHHLPLLDGVFPERPVPEDPARKDRIIALLLAEIRFLKEKQGCSKSTRSNR